MKKLIILFSFFSLQIFPQPYLQMIKIIDANTFMFSDSSVVKLHALFVPSINDEDSLTRELAKKIIKDEELNLLYKNFRLEFMTDDKSEANIFKEYLASDVNIAEWMLVNGYAYLKKENKYLNELFQFQKQAMNNLRGIWVIQEKLINKDIYKVKREISLLPLLTVSIAFGFLAYDNFSESSDIQKQIDNLKLISNNIDVSSWESIKNRKTLVGISSLVAAIITGFFSFQTIELEPVENGVNFKINY